MRPADTASDSLRTSISCQRQNCLQSCATPTSERQFIIYEALRKGASIDEIYDLTKIKHWFLQQMKELVDEEERAH